MTLLFEDVMTIRPREDFGHTLLLAGIRKSELARAANLSSQTIQRLANPKMYRNNDKGNVSNASARRIAIAFATLTSTTAEAAYEKLFEEIEDKQSAI